MEKDGNLINSISIIDGTPFYSCNAQHPRDRVSNIGLTEMSSIAYSKLLNCMVVGYQSGAILAVYSSSEVDTKTELLVDDRNFSKQFSTSKIHGSPICALHIISSNKSVNDYVISADESGVLATWILSPRYFETKHLIYSFCFHLFVPGMQNVLTHICGTQKHTLGG